jgi:pimeloyl-ACP methyl ester carboxylesterase
MLIEALRTPDERFIDLPDWPWTARYAEGLVADDAALRRHYVEEGPIDAAHTFLCLHGEPTWGYLYRRMIPIFVRSGARVIAPDLFGFGRSDKPVDGTVYTAEFHRRALVEFIDALDFQDLTLVVQDWGGLIGLTLPPPSRFTPLLVMHTTLGVGVTPSPGFAAWRAYAAKSPDLAVGARMRRSTPHLSDLEAAAYDAPFPDARHQAGVRRFPQLVPTHPDEPFAQLSREASAWRSNEWRGQCFMAIGMADPVFGPDVMERWRLTISGCPPAQCLRAAADTALRNEAKPSRTPHWRASMRRKTCGSLRRTHARQIAHGGSRAERE